MEKKLTKEKIRIEAEDFSFEIYKDKIVIISRGGFRTYIREYNLIHLCQSCKIWKKLRKGNLPKKKSKELIKLDSEYGNKLDDLCEKGLGKSKEARDLKKDWISKASKLNSEVRNSSHA